MRKFSVLKKTNLGKALLVSNMTVSVKIINGFLACCDTWPPLCHLPLKISDQCSEYFLDFIWCEGKSIVTRQDRALAVAVAVAVPVNLWRDSST